MKIALCCPSCDRRFLAEDEEGARTPCPGCGSTLGREVEPRAAPASRPEGAKAAPAARASTPAKKKAVVRPAPSQAAARPRPPAPQPAPEAPASAPAAPALAATDPDPEMVCPRCGLHFTPRPARREAPSGERHTVLVVEDMDYFRDIARDALEPQYRVESAETVEEAQAALLAGEIDLILLDLTLSEGEDGLRLLEKLPFKPCPILIYTAEDESDMYGEKWAQLQQLGADDVVIKGMNVGESILRKVGSLLGEDSDEDAVKP